MTLKEYLVDIDACDLAIVWLDNRTIEQAVAECSRGDWMLWLAIRVDIDKRLVVLAAARCANTVRHLMSDVKSTNAVDIALRYGKGLATEAELYAAIDAADLAVEKSACDEVAYPAALAICSLVYIETTDRCASHAAEAAGYADDVYAYGWDENQIQTAAICRELLGAALIEKVNQLLAV